MTAYIKLKTSDDELYDEKGQEHSQTINITKFSFKKFFEACIVWIKYVFHIITVKQIYQAKIVIFPFAKQKKIGFWSTKKYQYHMKNCINKLKRMVKTEKINAVILSDELKTDKIFLQQFLENDEIKKHLTLMNGKGVFSYLILEIVEYILQKQQKQTEMEDVYLLMHHNKQDYIDNILFLLHHFKTINIVTDNLKPFQLLAEKIEGEDGIPITVSNNKRKSLKRAQIIVNFDFQEEELKQYVIYRRAILIQAGNNASYENSTFDGIQVHHMDIEASQEIKELFEKYYLLGTCSLINLYEGILNQKENFLSVRRQLENDQVKVLNLYGKNGIINQKEYQRIKLETRKYSNLNIKSH
ncbi:MAG: hypothetical protein IJ777_01510 [Clostridia bacterium]|nr:hypothetical protein [Clostridia bacterium]